MSIKIFKYGFFALLIGVAGVFLALWLRVTGRLDFLPSFLFTKPGHVEKEVVGNLGGMPVAIPVYYLTSMEYEGDPSWGEKRNGPAPARTYQSRMMSFGATMRYPDMVGLINEKIQKDKAHHNIYDTPWIDVVVISGPIYPGNGFLDRQTFVIETPNDHWSDNYKKLNQSEYGLDIYALTGNNPFTGKPAREDEHDGFDVFIHRDSKGKVDAYIRCSNRKHAAAPCQQFFSLEGDNLKAEIHISYRRPMLQHWQDMQQKVRHLILSWRVTNNIGAPLKTSSSP